MIVSGIQESSEELPLTTLVVKTKSISYFQEGATIGCFIVLNLHNNFTSYRKFFLKSSTFCRIWLRSEFILAATVEP